MSLVVPSTRPTDRRVRTGGPPRASYYRLGVGRRTGQTTTAPGSAPWPPRCRSAGAPSPPTTPPPETTRPPQPAATENPRPPAEAGPTAHAPTAAPPTRLRTVHETSAGGLVIDGIDGPREAQVAALIGRVDRRGRMLWSLPKGHIEQGETAEQTAIREVAEETGIQGSVLAALGSIDYWFVTEGRRVHKTVHHYLMRFSGGELCDEDVEVTEVAWVPLAELPDTAGLRRRTPAGRGGRRTDRHSCRPTARRRCRRCRAPRRGDARRPIRTPATVAPTRPGRASPARGRTAAAQGRDGARPVWRSRAVPADPRPCSPCSRCPPPPRAAAAGEPGSAPFLQVRIDTRHPRRRHHHQRADASPSPARSPTSATGRCATSSCVSNTPPRSTSSAGLRTNLAGGVDQYQPVGDFITVAPELAPRPSTCRSRFSYPLRADNAPSLRIDKPGVYPLLVNVNGTPDYGAAGPPRRRPLPAAGPRRAAGPGATPAATRWPTWSRPTPPNRLR